MPLTVSSPELQQQVQEIRQHRLQRLQVRMIMRRKFVDMKLESKCDSDRKKLL